MQDVKSAIDELERAVTKLGLKGAELDTQVNGEQWDEPKFLPFFKAAEAMGAVLFFHPQPQNNFLKERTPRDGLFNSLGVILDDAIVTAILICGGVLEACPDIRICIAHGGGPACYAMGRLDRGWQKPSRGAPYPAAAERIPAPSLLRHRDRQRGSATLPARPGGGRPRGPRQRLALCTVETLARGLGAGPEVPDAGGKGQDSLEEPGGVAEAVDGQDYIGPHE